MFRKSQLFYVTAAILVFISYCSIAHGQVFITHVSGITVAYDTTLGNFGIGHEDGRRLTYTYTPPNVPWETDSLQTHFILKVDDYFFTNHIAYMIHCPGAVYAGFHLVSHEIDTITPQITTTWELPVESSTVTFKQILTPTWFDDLGQVRIEYEITNNDEFHHNVGLLLFINSKLNDQDNPRVQFNRAWIDTGSVWNYPYIPSHFRFYENSLDTFAMIAMGFFREGDATPPDHLVNGQAEGLTFMCWEFDPAFYANARIGESIEDLAILMKWDALVLGSSMTREYVTYYGLGDMPSLPPPEPDFETYDVRFDVTECLRNECLQLSAIVTNNDTLMRTLTDIHVCIRLEDEIHYYLDPAPPYSDDSCIITTPSTLGLGESGIASWRLCLNDPDYCSETGDTIFWRTWYTEPAGGDNMYATSIITVECFSGIPPEAEILTPPGIVACRTETDSLIQFVIRDDEAVDHRSTRLKIWDSDTSMFITRFSLRWRIIGDSLYKLAIPRLFLTETGDTVHVRVEEAYDIHGCSIEDHPQTFFVTDFSVPSAEILFPSSESEGPVITSPLPTIVVEITDEPCGAVDPTSIEMEVDDNIYTYSDGSWLPSYSTFNFTVTESLESGDTVSICVNNVQDSVDYCEPNSLAEPVCWEYLVDYLPPCVEIAAPDSGIVTACEHQEIEIVLRDACGIDWDSVAVAVAGVTYYCSSPEVDCGGESFIFSPVPAYVDCELIEFQVLSACDIYGNEIECSVSGSFHTDFSAPRVVEIDGGSPFPWMGMGVSGSGLVAQLALTDDCSEINPSSITLEVCNLDSGICETFNITDAPVTWEYEDSLLWIFFAFHGVYEIPQVAGDTIQVCLTNAADIIPADYCGPNELEEPYCWHFYLTESGINDKIPLPNSFYLTQNHPNPFNETTTFEFGVAQNSLVEISVYNVLGERVQTLLNGKLEAGVRRYQWDASNLTSGIYFCYMRAGEFTQVRRMLLLK
ncbi:T9SS type A sorting domain-containing protein [bacterium]|nr:T9SS type A sorting domain-containing protein [bacterium]